VPRQWRGSGGRPERRRGAYPARPTQPALVLVRAIDLQFLKAFERGHVLPANKVSEGDAATTDIAGHERTRTRAPPGPTGDAEHHAELAFTVARKIGNQHGEAIALYTLSNRRAVPWASVDGLATRRA
jgi:hypothetical protein